MIKITLSKEPIHLVDLVNINDKDIYIIDKKHSDGFLCRAFGIIRISDGVLVIRRLKYGQYCVEHLNYSTYGIEWFAYYVKRIVEDFT